MKDDFSMPPHDVADRNDNQPNTANQDDTNFKTPEEIASAEEIQESPQTPSIEKKGFFARFSHKNLTKKQKIILVVLLVVILAGLLAFAWTWKNRKPVTSSNTPAAKKEAVQPKPTSEPSKLTGREVALDVNQRPVIAVMIENSPDARPQAGLKDAGVVFEAVAEGGITRFLTLFQDTEPDYIGPVRSARPYYVEWEMGFDAPYAHVGGSADGLARIKALGVKDLDQSFNAGAFERIKTRFAPHNVYTSIAKLRDLAKSKGWTSSDFTGFTRKKEAPQAAPTYKSIDVAMSGFLYNPHWDYDQTTNSYLRSQAGKPHMDDKSAQQISSKVVVIMVMNKGLAADGSHTLYSTNGSGKVYVFQDGGVVEGTWSKTEAKSQISFTDAAGKPIALNPGQTWVTVAGSSNDVAAKP